MQNQICKCCVLYLSRKNILIFHCSWPKSTVFNQTHFVSVQSCKPVVRTVARSTNRYKILKVKVIKEKLNWAYYFYYPIQSVQLITHLLIQTASDPLAKYVSSCSSLIIMFGNLMYDFISVEEILTTLTSGQIIIIIIPVKKKKKV